MNNVKLILIAMLSVTASACGGGGGSNNSAQLIIDASNAKDIASAALKINFGSISTYQAFSPSNFAYDVIQTTYQGTAQLPCTHLGSTQGTKDTSYSPNGTGSIVYTNCIGVTGDTFNGKLTLENINFTQPVGTGTDVISAKIISDFANPIRVSGSGYAEVTVNGSYALNATLDTLTHQVLSDAAQTDSFGTALRLTRASQTNVISNFHFTHTADQPNFGDFTQSGAFDFSGSITPSLSGSFSYESIEPFVTTLGNYPDSGKAIITGGGFTSLCLKVLNSTQVQTAISNDHCANFTNLIGTYDWANLAP